MSFMLSCPNCGVRRVDEFRFGGELRERPHGDVTPHAWGAYLYERANIAGPQREWWYHRQGCKQWFVAVRDTTTNTVLETALETAWLTPAKGEQHAQEPDPRAAATPRDADAGPG